MSLQESGAKNIYQGNIIAIVYLKNKDFDLLAEISGYSNTVRPYVIKDIFETLIGNIFIPRDLETEDYSRRSIKGILTLIGEQAPLKKILTEIDDLFTSYEADLQQAYTQLKNDFGVKLEESKKDLEQQLDARVEYYVERQSQFREKWRKMRAELGSHYDRVLEDCKQRLLNEV